nr:MAG TPA_asm: Biotin-(acetyl-CoA carboxylase) ligase [Caudoviricetes sp.]
MISFGVRPTIKWPNDILIDGAKVCGVLIEYAGAFVVVGIGINIKSNPTVPEYQTTKLERYADIERTDLLNRLMRNLDKWMRTDFATVRARWMELATALNKVVRYRGENVELIGINESGALVLRRGTQYLLAYGDEISM